MLKLGSEDNLFIGLSMFVTSGGAGYQYLTWKLKQSCFEVDNNSLLQTPFTFDCMREVDCPILILTVVAMIFCILMIIIVSTKIALMI